MTNDLAVRDTGSDLGDEPPVDVRLLFLRRGPGPAWPTMLPAFSEGVSKYVRASVEYGRIVRRARSSAPPRHVDRGPRGWDEVQLRRWSDRVAAHNEVLLAYVERVAAAEGTSVEAWIAAATWRRLLDEQHVRGGASTIRDVTGVPLVLSNDPPRMGSHGGVQPARGHPEHEVVMDMRPDSGVTSLSESEPDRDETEAVLNALADQRWDFRSVAGLAKCTGLSEERVELIVDRLGDVVRRPLATDGTDRELYALAVRRPRWSERYLALRQRLAIW